MYTSNKKPLDLTVLPSLADDDVFIVGDASDTEELVKIISKADLVALLRLALAAVEEPPETPNAIITSFTASAQPKWVVSDSNTYFEGAGYSYVAPNVIMEVPPSEFIRFII